MSLSLSEKYQLLNKYKTELKLLQFQIEKVQETIHDIEQDINDSSNSKKVVKDKPNREAFKSRTLYENSTTVLSNRPDPVKSIEKEEEVRGYKLSDWDIAIIDILENFQKVMLQLEIRERIFERKNLVKNLSEDQAMGKINRCLQKLVNKRGMVIKIPYVGKGFLYGLNEWLDKEGKLPVVRLRKEH